MHSIRVACNTYLMLIIGIKESVSEDFIVNVSYKWVQSFVVTVNDIAENMIIGFRVLCISYAVLCLFFRFFE